MIHYFNPGHETAVWTDSPYYQPPASVVKIQEDLAFLPFWYADSQDVIFLPRPLLYPFEKIVENRNIRPFVYSSPDIDISLLNDQKVEFWGLSRQAICFFTKYAEQSGSSFNLPEWNDAYRELCSREFAAECLSALLMDIPEIPNDILPLFCENLSEIEQLNTLSSCKLLIKSPYSSSGRGLLWLELRKLSRFSRQILQGMLNRQTKVSVERVLDKVLDFSMHFTSNEFSGYSIFRTNTRGAYEKTWLASQDKVELKLSSYIDLSLLAKVKTFLEKYIKEKIRPYYQGNIGIDMMIYRSGVNYFLHPCVEINLRKSMGFLSLRLFHNHLHPDMEGYFSVVYNSDANAEFPVFPGNGCFKSGVLYDLCPINPATKYRALLDLT
jgi:hypothetical protein